MSSGTSTTASDLGSDVSSQSWGGSSAFSDKLKRVVAQLEAIKIAKSNPQGDHMKMAMGEESSKEPVVEKPELVIPHGKTPMERVAAILRMAKAKRLSAETSSAEDENKNGPRTTCMDGSDDERIPDYVPCHCLLMMFLSFSPDSK